MSSTEYMSSKCSIRTALSPAIIVLTNRRKDITTWAFRSVRKCL